MNHSAWQPARLALVVVAVTVATASCGSSPRYSEAKTIYLLARILAEAAAETVETRKAALRAQPERDLADSELRWRELERRARVRIAAWSASRAARREWDEDVARAKAAPQSAKALIHDDPPEANANLTALDIVLTKWERQLRLPRTSQWAQAVMPAPGESFDGEARGPPADWW